MFETDIPPNKSITLFITHKIFQPDIPPNRSITLFIAHKVAMINTKETCLN